VLLTSFPFYPPSKGVYLRSLQEEDPRVDSNGRKALKLLHFTQHQLSIYLSSAHSLCRLPRGRSRDRIEAQTVGFGGDSQKTSGE
jgi:hypothetical protein